MDDGWTGLTSQRFAHTHKQQRKRWEQYARSLIRNLPKQNDESTIAILYARRAPSGFEQLQHYDRPGHIEATGESFRSAHDRR